MSCFKYYLAKNLKLALIWILGSSFQSIFWTSNELSCIFPLIFYQQLNKLVKIQLYKMLKLKPQFVVWELEALIEHLFELSGEEAYSFYLLIFFMENWPKLYWTWLMIPLVLETVNMPFLREYFGFIFLSSTYRVCFWSTSSRLQIIKLKSENKNRRGTNHKGH